MLKKLTGTILAVSFLLGALPSAMASEEEKEPYHRYHREGSSSEEYHHGGYYHSPGAKMEFYGRVEEGPAEGRLGLWIIGGHRVEIDSQTRIEEEHGRFQKGVYVEVEGWYDHPKRVIRARKIEVKSPNS